MKKAKISFYALGTALLLTAASCSNDIIDDGADVYDGPVKTSYLSVNLVSGGGQTTTRAGEAPGTYDEGDEGVYQDGTGKENAVENVRFYFFKKDGSSADVKNIGSGDLVNYYDWTISSNDPEDGEVTLTPDDNNVEKIINAQLIINTKQGDELPYYVVVVVNLPEELKEVAITSIDAPNDATSLNAQIANYQVDLREDAPFIMTNSVYLNSSNNYEEQVNVQPFIFDDPDYAKANPATIYVERVNAKAEVSITTGQNLEPVTGGNFEGRNVYKTTVSISNSDNDENINEDGTNPLEDGAEIYVEFLGWDVTCTTNQSYLMKHINNDAQKWTNSSLFGSATAFDWNSPTRFRSFWAINPALKYTPGQEGNNYVYGTYNQILNEELVFASGQEKNNYTYLQENAGLSALDPSCAHPTQLIVAAKLLDANGDDLTLAQYGAQQFTLDGLKKKYASLCNIYIRSELESGTEERYKFEQIPWQAITFQTAVEAGQAFAPTAEGDEGGRYYVYAKLDTQNAAIAAAIASDNLWIGTDNNEDPATVAQADASLIECGHAKIWNEGCTYYYINIRHLGVYNSEMEKDPSKANPATWGIVRNHIYSMNINSLTGLGTPVYNPNEVIYPEHPEEKDSYIGAEIKILNWRLVRQDVGFAW